MFTAVGAHRRAQSRKASSYIEHYAFRTSCVCSSVPKTHSGTCLATCPWIQGHTSMLSSQRHASVECATCVTLAHTGVQTTVPHIYIQISRCSRFLTTSTVLVFRHVTLMEACTPTQSQRHSSCLCAQGLLFPSTCTQHDAGVCLWRGVHTDPRACPHRRDLYTRRCECVLCRVTGRCCQMG